MIYFVFVIVCMQGFLGARLWGVQYFAQNRACSHAIASLLLLM